MWLKLSTMLKYMPLTPVCSCSSVRRWMQSTYVFFYTQKWNGFLKVDHWTEFLSYESCSRDFFQKNSHHWQHISVTQNGLQHFITCVTYSTYSMNSICHFRAEWQLCSSWQIKCLHSSHTGIMVAMSGHWDSWNVSNISRDFERDWARALFVPASAWSPFSALKRVWALLPSHKRTMNWKGMDLWPICE